MSSFRLALIAGAASLGLASAAHADTFTQTVQFGPGPTDYNSATGTTNGPGNNMLFYFDTNGGTLNSITISSSYGFNSTITVTNTSGSSSTGNARTQSASQFGANASAIQTALNSIVNNYVDPVDGNAVSFGNSTLSPIAYDVRGTANNYSLASGGSTSFASSGNSSHGPVTDTTASDLAAFSQAGGGTFTPLFSTLSGLVVSNSGGNTTAVQTTTATGTLSLSYNYTVNQPPVTTVPEPASLMVLGAGLLGLAAIRRKRV